MKKQYIEFKCEHQKITRTDDFFVVGKSKNYLHAKFDLCDDWAGEQVTAVFEAAGKPYTRLIENGECCVPWEVLLCKNFFVSCFAGDMITSNSAEVKVNPGGACGGVPGVEPTPSAYEQIISIMEETKDIAQSVRDDADNGVFDGEQGPKGDPQDAVCYTKQTLTEEQKEQARKNIGSVDPEYFALIADEVGTATNDIWFIYDALNNTVSVDNQQWFEESQMAQARKNIGATTIDDSSVGADTWSSKNTVDRLCPDIAESGAVVSCEPIAGYPLQVVTQLPTDGCTGLTLRHFGENLLNVTATSKKENGVTFTANSDGSITTTGTATADAFLELGKVQLLNGKSYVLAGCPKNGGQSKHSIYYSSYYDTGTGETITPGKTVNATFRIKIASGTPTDGLVFRPVVYEKNKGKTYSVKFGTTINGGIYDWNSGVLEYGSDEDYSEMYFDEQTITALDGVNTLWVDVGTNTVTGKANPVAVINKLTNAILALGGNV